MNDIKITIITPVFCAEKTLERCLHSILAQTFHEWECVLVDDGSLDKSGILCDEFANKDSRFLVIHQSNSGVSIARQRGLEKARGEYVIHIDPDDWVEPDMLELLYKKAIEKHDDIVACNFFWDYYNGCIVNNQTEHMKKSNDMILSLFSGDIHSSCCNKLVKRSFLVDNNISFPRQLSLFEDKYVFCSILLRTPSIGYVDKALYHYSICEDSNSISTGYKQSLDYDEMMMDLFCELFNNTKYYPVVKDYFIDFIVNRAFYRHDLTNSQFRKRCLKYCKHIQIRKRSIFLWFSCVGLYNLMYSINRSLSK